MKGTLTLLLMLAGLAGLARWAEGTAAPVPQGWAYDLATRLGNPAPTQETVDFLSAWARAENTQAAYNPLATTQPAEGDTCFNYLNGRCGVRSYPDYQTGIDATVETLANGAYPLTLAGLQGNNPVVVDSELATWGTGAAAVRAQLEETHTRVSSTKSYLTPTMAIGSHFSDVSCSAWGFQVGCQHWGTDYLGDEGTPVYAPFDLTITSVGEYGPGPTAGQFVQGVLGDGLYLYLGHLTQRQVGEGDFVKAGSLLGYMGKFGPDWGPHTHAQLGRDSSACAQTGTCLDFEAYYAEH